MMDRKKKREVGNTSIYGGTVADRQFMPEVSRGLRATLTDPLKT